MDAKECRSGGWQPTNQPTLVWCSCNGRPIDGEETVVEGSHGGSLWRAMWTLNKSKPRTNCNTVISIFKFCDHSSCITKNKELVGWFLGHKPSAKCHPWFPAFMHAQREIGEEFRLSHVTLEWQRCSKDSNSMASILRIFDVHYLLSKD